MSKSKTLLGLFIVAGFLAFYLLQKEPKNTQDERFIAALSANESAVNSLTRVLVSQGDQQFDMVKEDTGWRLNDGFYVRMDSLSKWIQALKNARLIEPKTANPNNFPALSLTENDLRVRIYQNQTLISDIILGQSGRTPDARFVRFYDDNQSWLASGLNGLTSSVEVWQLALIFDVPDSQVKVIEWSADKTLRFTKNTESGQWQQANEQTASASLDPQKIATLAASLSGFRIQQANKTTADSLKPWQSFVFGLEAGRQISIEVYRTDSDTTFFKVADSQQPGRYEGWQMTLPDYKLETFLIEQSAVFDTQSEGDDVINSAENNNTTDGQQPST